MNENNFGQFVKQNYINIETYRKSGEAVKTPVWFVEDGGALYTSTGARSGKVKRLQRNPAVKIVPCSMKGDPRGTWMNANAEVVNDQTQMSRVESLMKKKYGLQITLFGLFRRGDTAGRATVKIQITK